MATDTYKTTDDDLTVFKSYFENMRAKLGLSGWRIIFAIKDIGDADAKCFASMEDRFVRIRLSCEFDEKPTHEDLKHFAEHEALELLLIRLVIIGMARFVTESEMHDARHEVIQILQPLLTAN